MSSPVQPGALANESVWSDGRRGAVGEVENEAIEHNQSWMFIPINGVLGDF